MSLNLLYVTKFKENKRKKKKKVKEKERKEKVSPRKTNRLRFERSSCTIQALMYCKCSRWLLRFDLRRLVRCLFSLFHLSFKKIYPQLFIAVKRKQKGAITNALDYTNIRSYCQRLP